MILKIPENQPEEHRHIRMVVKRHLCSFFDEKKHEAVVFCVLTSNCHSVQIALEVVRIVAACDTKHFWS